MPKDLKNELRPEDFENALREMDIYTDIVVDDLMELNARAEKYARLRMTEGSRVADIMSQPVRTVRPDCKLAEVAHLFITQRISGVPVVNEQAQLIGIITEADFLRALGVPGHHATHSLWHTLESMFSHHLELKDPDNCVSDLMVTDVITVNPGQSVHDVIEAMKKYRIKRIVVVDDDRQVVGMITRTDLVRIFFDRIRGATSRHPSA